MQDQTHHKEAPAEQATAVTAACPQQNTLELFAGRLFNDSSGAKKVEFKIAKSDTFASRLFSMVPGCKKT